MVLHTSIMAVPEVVPLSRRRIEHLALQLVQSRSPNTLSAHDPFPVHQVCEFHLEALCGVSFAVDRLPSGTEGRFEGGELIINEDVYDALLRNDPRARFTLAHELAHCMLHKEQLDVLNSRKRGIVQLHRRGMLAPYRDPEWQADTYAGAVLMPAQVVKEIYDSIPDILRPAAPRYVADKLSVSLRAAEVRISILKEMEVLRP